MVYTLLFMLLLGWVLNIFSKKYALARVSYNRKISQRVVEIDEDFEITTILENNKFLPITFLQVVEKFPAMLTYKFKAEVLSTVEYVFHKTTVLLKPYERVSRVYTVAAKQRGKYSFRDVTLIAGDLLGLDTSVREVEFNQEIVVLPKALPPAENLRPCGGSVGDVSVQRWIVDDPVLLIGVREYTGLEPQRTIHWPSSLRAGHLMVKQFDHTTENSVMILLNIESARPFWVNIENDKIEKCISLARGIVDELEPAGIPYGFSSDAYVGGCVGSLKIQNPGIGPYHYAEIVESLGRMINSLSLGFEDFLSNFIRGHGGCSTYVLITPTVLEPYVDSINRLSQKAAKTVVISLDREHMDDLAANILKFGATAAGL